jgi:uracil-DNA glycosylase family 4
MIRVGATEKSLSPFSLKMLCFFRECHEISGDPSMNSSKPVLDAGAYGTFRDLLRASDCRRCGLATGRTGIVVDRGDPSAGIMAIGEGPGEQEDLQGKAFVGRSGQLMDRLFAEAGIDTDRHFLIANIVKCRPPANRAPRREEVEACLPYLRKQIDLVRPHTVILLGAVAVRRLLKEKGAFSMKERAGKIFSSPHFPGLDLMVLYHPAYLLRDPRRQPDFLRHIEGLKAHLQPAGRWPGV